MVRPALPPPRWAHEVLQSAATETDVGGKEKNKHARDRKGGTQSGAGKAIVFDMIERDGELRAFVVDDLKAETVQTVARENVAKSSTLMTN